MKILVLGTARSKSNYITASLAEYYKLDYIYEPYRVCFEENIKRNYTKNLIDSLKKVTQLLDKRDNFVMKLEVTNLIPNGYNRLLNLNLFNWKNFDKIFTTSRINLSDTIASLTIAQDLGRYFNTKDSLPSPKITPREFSIKLRNDRISVYSALRDREILKATQEWLKKNNINYTEVFYETADTFIKNELRDARQNIWLKNDYDYQSIFTNYSEIENLANDLKKYILQQYKFETS